MLRKLMTDLPQLKFSVKCTLITDVYEMKSDNQFASMLYDNIRRRGSMHKLISDHVQVEISINFKHMLRASLLDD